MEVNVNVISEAIKNLEHIRFVEKLIEGGGTRYAGK